MKLVAALATAALAGGLTLRPARGAEGGRPFVARGFIGTQAGAAFGITGADGLLVGELSQGFLVPGHDRGSLTEVSLRGQTAPVGLWASGRVGYLLAVIHFAGADHRDVSHSGDVSAGVGFTSRGGHTLALEYGLEVVRRSESLTCCDSVLARSSRGARIQMTASFAVGPRVSIDLRAGGRFGDHIPEVVFLPLLVLGVAAHF